MHLLINAAGNIYNHCIALHKRYYRMFGKHLNKHKLQKHIAKLRRKNTPRTSWSGFPTRRGLEYWQLVGSQAVQDITDRIERAYQLFFKHHSQGVRPPNFRKRIKYKSFTLKQAGYKLLENNQIKVGKRVYRFWKSREIEGKIKTVTIKRNPLGEIFIFVVTDHFDSTITATTGKSAGFDFGLKVFLTCSDQTEVKSPLLLKQSLKKLKLASRQHSTKKQESNSREKASQVILRVGASTLRGGDVSLSQTAISA